MEKLKSMVKISKIKSWPSERLLEFAPSLIFCGSSLQLENTYICSVNLKDSPLTKKLLKNVSARLIFTKIETERSRLFQEA